MRRRPFTVRAIALLGAGSAVTHQLRYSIGYGSQAPHALSAHAHGYLSLALPGILTALLIVIGGVVMRSAGAGAQSRHAIGIGFTALWLACTLLLALIYGTQETLEGSGALAGGGWIGFALTVPVGLLAALCLRGADAAESLTVRRPLTRLVAPVVECGMHPRLEIRPRSVITPLGGRGPPALLVV